MTRKDSFGVEVEVGDIVLSCPRHKWSGKPEVGQVSGVFDSGRVTIKIPTYTSVYAYERGAPDKPSTKWDRIRDEDGNQVYTVQKDYFGRDQKVPKFGKVPCMVKDYTVVDKQWKWMRKQAADITLIVLRKSGEQKKGLEEILAERVGFNDLTRNLNLDYSTERPNLS